MEKKKQVTKMPSKFARAKNPNFFNCDLEVKVETFQDFVYSQIDLEARQKLIFEKLEPNSPLKKIEALLPSEIAKKLHQIEESLARGDG